MTKLFHTAGETSFHFVENKTSIFKKESAESLNNCFVLQTVTFKSGLKYPMMVTVRVTISCE